MDKRGSHTRAFLFLLVAFLVVFATASFLAYTKTAKTAETITGKTISINNQNTIQVPDSRQPLPNENEGTIVLWTKPPVEIFDQFSDARDYIIFYSSTNVPGLRVVYNIKEKRFEAGSPLLESPEIDIFDGKNHQVVYTFKKDHEQAIFLDGSKVASSDFRPMRISDVTGFATLIPTVQSADISGIEIAMYDRYMPEKTFS